MTPGRWGEKGLVTPTDKDEANPGKYHLNGISGIKGCVRFTPVGSSPLSFHCVF